jgi:hypothetical protein
MNLIPALSQLHTVASILISMRKRTTRNIASHCSTEVYQSPTIVVHDQHSDEADANALQRSLHYRSLGLPKDSSPMWETTSKDPFDRQSN